MKRDTLLKRLEAALPSASLPYYRWGEERDKKEDRSWLYIDSDSFRDSFGNGIPRLPEKIPADFLCGITAEYNGRTLVSGRRPDRDYRKVTLNVTDYASYGNTHKYGSLCIEGLNWLTPEGGYLISSSLRDVEPRVVSFWNSDLRHIIRPEDGFREADGYETGEGTQRFTSLTELYTVAAYVVLLRILGPVRFYDCDRCVVPKSDELILQVDDDDNVIIGKAFEIISGLLKEPSKNS